MSRALPEYHFDWRTLELRFTGRRPCTELPAAEALAAAYKHLEDAGARVEQGEGEHVLTFCPTFRSGRSWLNCVMGGEVRARADARETVVDVRASLSPLATFTALGAGGVLAVGMGWVGLLLVLGPVGIGNYVFVHLGLRAIVLAALRGPAVSHRAA